MRPRWLPQWWGLAAIMALLFAACVFVLIHFWPSGG